MFNMRKASSSTTIFLLLIIQLFISCKKDPPKVIPTLTTNTSELTSTTITASGSVTSDGGAEVTSRGFCWNTSPDPTTANQKSSNGVGIGTFTTVITDLLPGTMYYLRSYAINSIGTGYGNTVTFTTPAQAPSLSTTQVSSITSTSAISGGDITSDGGSPITARGVCWDTKENPTILNAVFTTGDNEIFQLNAQTSDGTGKGIFVSSITGLAPGTAYYIRAYARNSVGTAYGNQVSATTAAILPVLTTADASSITSTSATSGGNITNDGGASVTARGVCWSTTPDPTIAGSKTTNGTGPGSFTSSITGLSPGTQYYIKAYATNSVGTAYGNQITITTPAAVPVISTTNSTSVTSTSFTSGGYIISNGGANVTERGVCWSTTQNPTIAGSRTSNGTGTGSFTSTITGLTPGTTYYIRAYATNSVGTAYGDQVTTTTTAVLAAVTTANPSSISATSLTSGGNITSDGGANVTERGVCWSTTQNPTISGSKTTSGTGTGSFTSQITGLTPGTTYYLRAYATNSIGTAYGNQVTATTINQAVIVGSSSSIQNLNAAGDFVFQLNNLTNNNVYFIFSNTNTSTLKTLPTVEGSNVPNQFFNAYQQTYYEDNKITEDREISKFNNNPGRYANRGVYDPGRLQTPVTKAGSYILGSTENFIDYYSTNPLPSTLRKIINANGKNLHVWVADDCWSSSSPKANYVTQQMVDELSVKFLNTGTNDDIYEWVTNIIGSPWEQTSYSNLIPGTNDIHIMLCDIKNDNSTNGGTIGYFWGGNNYLKTSVAKSNEKLLFFADAVLLATPGGSSWEITDYWPQTLVSTLAHEFQHMIHFYQKAIKNDIPSNTAVNEMASMCIEDLIANKIFSNGPRGVAYGTANAGSASNTSGRLPGYNSRNYYNLLDWSDNDDEVYLNYSKTYAFGAYLMRNYGGANLIKQIVQNSFTGVNCIVDAVNQNGGAGLTYENILRNFGAANLMSDNTNLTQGYILNTGTWFTSSVNGITYQVGSINLYNYNPSPFLYITLPATQRAGSNLYYAAGTSVSGSKQWSFTGLNSEIKITVVIK